MLWVKLGGGTRIILTLANELVKRGHDVSITAVGTKKDIAWFPLQAKLTLISPYRYMYARGVSMVKRRIFKMNDFRNKFYWDVIWDLARQTPDCDINIATYAMTAYSVYLSRKGKPFYYMQHYEPSTLNNDPTSERLFEGSYFLPLKKIANSSWLKNEIKEKLGMDVSAIEVSPSAVNTDMFYKRNVTRFPRNQGMRRVVCMGRPDAWKGFPDALSAMRIVMKERNDVEFYVYAFKDELPKLDGAPYTLLTGISGENLAELLSSADIVLAPSWLESSPLPVLEAMACGAALVTTRYGTEDFAFDGKNSLVVPPKNPEAIARALLKLLADEAMRADLIKNGFMTAKNFNWQRSVERIETLFAL